MKRKSFKSKVKLELNKYTGIKDTSLCVLFVVVYFYSK